eukprot:TRINITY_DN10768_c0_g1_i1.p1 TRINITY_DN10768_c0_g1~~TRINITY_DN10768_c0_g1_i1.p1  ORF type:complete len:440 (-),score=42.83 TRINITY_DN10768_c0_g1_i1:1391-2710(-)
MVEVLRALFLHRHCGRYCSWHCLRCKQQASQFPATFLRLLSLAVLVGAGCLERSRVLVIISMAKTEAEHSINGCEAKALETIAKRSFRVLRNSPFSMCALFICFVVWDAKISFLVDLRYESVFVIIMPIAAFMISRFELVLVGIGPPSLRDVLRFLRRRSSCHTDNRHVASKPGEVWTSGDTDWDEKVMELGLRGVTLQALLEFYFDLGAAVMPHYDAAVNTTADVVRQAIIPTTRGTAYGDCALATLLMENRRILPKKLVTHSWSNRFIDLIAAVVADALELPTYQTVGWRLMTPQEHAALWEELRLRGRLGMTYWICAFSVNQHTCICHQLYGNMEDTTGRELSTCPCKTEKYLPSSLPVRNDGQSINCDINKFHDMMDWFASVNPKFSQCIAIDRHLDLFHRAWCIAEIHRAHRFALLVTGGACCNLGQAASSARA